MTEREAALYRYLIGWADFTPAEARAAVAEMRRTDELKSSGPESPESIECSMGHNQNRRAA